jgi:hypothetical protein
MKNDFDGLSDAISDVGYWNWWTADFPDYIMLEFGGTQIWSNPKDAGSPPSGKLALTFRKLNSVSFITTDKYGEKMPKDWPELLQNDKIHQPDLIKGVFTLHDMALINNIIKEATEIKTVHGYEPTKPEFNKSAFKIGFWAHNCGCIIGSDWLSIQNNEGNLSLGDLKERNIKWWKYWEEYWKRKGGNDPLPEDYACDVTIPPGTEITLPAGTKTKLP